MTQQEVNGAFEDKMRRRIFDPVKRHLKIGHEAEDRWQDAVAQVWAMYSRYAQREEILDDALLVHACRLRATDMKRRFAGTLGGQPDKSGCS